MALGFFRRRQKMVIIVMVVLMVSFLVGGIGISSLLQTNPNKAPMGNTRFGELTRGELMSAEADIEALQAIGLGSNPYRVQQWPLEMAFVQLSRSASENKAVYAYALLLKEADAAGVAVGQHDVDEFFQSIVGADQSAYKSLISSLRSSRQGWTEQFIRGAVASWLRIFKAYTDASVDCPPSETELLATWRDIKEEIGLGVIRLKAEDFVKGLPDPNQDVIRKQFDTYRTVYPDERRQPTQMGFGYKQPGRAIVQYLLLSGEVIGRVTEPSSDTLIDYYNRNKGEFFREAPADPTTKPADANTPTIRVPLTFAEAKTQVIERLRETTLRARMDELTTIVDNNVKALLRSSTDPNTVYQKVLDGMITPAGDALAKPLKGLKIENVSLKDAVGRLADASGLTAICFPWGTQGSQTLLPTVKVSLTGDMKLREALDKICEQVKWPRLEWAGCQGFNNMIFSVKVAGQGMDFFPIKVAETPLWSYEQFSKDDVLGTCYVNVSGQGPSLAQTVFTAAGLSENPNQPALVKIGEQGRRMYLVAFTFDPTSGEKIGVDNGRLMWRLVRVAPAHVPQMMTPEIHQQVINDLKLAAAMRLAEKDAATIRDGAEKVGLATAAERKGLKMITTGLFPRRQLDMNWSNIPNLDDLNTPALQVYLIPKMFDLMPKSAEPNAPASGPAVTFVPIPAKAEVLVIQRLDYKPVLRQEYEDLGRLGVAQFLIGQRRFMLQAAWFNDRNIRLRTDYKQ